MFDVSFYELIVVFIVFCMFGRKQELVAIVKFIRFLRRKVSIARISLHKFMDSIMIEDANKKDTLADSDSLEKNKD